MRRVLMLSPHFPPDSSAGAHRVRILAPHLAAHGWEPTVLAVDPRDYDWPVDPELADWLPATLPIVRCRAWPAHLTRRIGVGDLGLRAWANLSRACTRLFDERRFDAVFITIYPTYPALLAPLLRRRFKVPVVLDYQDPWVGEWGRTVGPGPGGTPNIKSRISRALGQVLEPIAISAVDAMTAVSRRTFEDVQARNPRLRQRPCAAIPIGFDPEDFKRAGTGKNCWFDPNDGDIHLCYVGTLLPLGFETLRALLRAAAQLRTRSPRLYARLRLHFFGTSNQFDPDAPARVLPEALRAGVADIVSELPQRIRYGAALAVQAQASGILLLGSSQPHYTASKLYPALMSHRPLIAAFHAASSVVEILRAATCPPAVRLIVYDDNERAESMVDSLAVALADLIVEPKYDQALVDWNVVNRFSAPILAGQLAHILDEAYTRVEVPCPYG